MPLNIVQYVVEGHAYLVALSRINHDEIFKECLEYWLFLVIPKLLLSCLPPTPRMPSMHALAGVSVSVLLTLLMVFDRVYVWLHDTLPRRKICTKVDVLHEEALVV